MSRSNWDLLAVSAVALVAALVSTAFGGQSNLVKAALGVPFVLFLPGYALAAVLLPDARTGLAERVAVSVGLSIAFAALGGLLLNFLPAGLTAASWRFLLLGVTLSAAGYALWRRETQRIPGPGRLVVRVSVREAALVTSAALLIGLALGLSALGISPTSAGAPSTGSASADTGAFTQMWAIPQQTGTSGDGQRVIQVGLRNYEGASVTYRVTLEAGGNIFAEWPQVTIRNGESWQAQALVPGNLGNQDVTANAYREGDPTPYRHVRVAAAYGSSGK